MAVTGSAAAARGGGEAIALVDSTAPANGDRTAIAFDGQEESCP